MLLDDFLESSVIQLGELGQVIHIGNDVTQVFFQQQEVLFSGCVITAVLGSIWSFMLLHSFQDCIDLLLRCFDAFDDLLTLDSLEGEDLVQLSLHLLDAALLVLVGPWLAVRLGPIRRGFGLVGGFEGIFQAGVVDVVDTPVLDERRLKVMAEPAAMKLVSWSCGKDARPSRTSF